MDIIWQAYPLIIILHGLSSSVNTSTKIQVHTFWGYYKSNGFTGNMIFSFMRIISSFVEIIVLIFSELINMPKRMAMVSAMQINVKSDCQIISIVKKIKS